MKKRIEEKMYEKGIELIILGLRVTKPDLNQKDAENFIINVGNYLQLKRLKRGQQWITPSTYSLLALYYVGVGYEKTQSKKGRTTSIHIYSKPLENIFDGNKTWNVVRQY